MGYYLNSAKPCHLFSSEVERPYYADKSLLIEELLPLVKTGNRHICITRPRRFGKTVAAAMIAAFFTKETDSSGVFDLLKISGNPFYREHLNQHDVIYINFLEAANLSSSYDDFLGRIEKPLSRDLRRAFPDVDFWDDASPVEDLRMINEETDIKFILVLDEWDCIFHKSFITETDRKRFINFLAALTKDTGYISLTYMTGVLPVAKYSSGSSINHFDKYNMARTSIFSDYFGFTDTEVDELYLRFLKNTKQPAFSRAELTDWYDGYQFKGKENIYNPRSVVTALTRNELGSYWSATGQFSEIAEYIARDADGIKLAVARMVAGEPVPVDMQEYAVSAMKLDTKDRILSAMVVYGFLTYDETEKTVRIPNKELLDEFEKTIREETSVGYINRLARVSDRILKATLNGEADTVAEALSAVHKDTPIMAYNSEAELSTVVYFAYLSALDTYEIRRENQAGRGYADFIFYPRDLSKDGIIIELKKDQTPDKAIQQIKDRHYVQVFQSRLAEEGWHGRRILAVGITYDSDSGQHRCKIEELYFNHPFC